MCIRTLGLEEPRGSLLMRPLDSKSADMKSRCTRRTTTPTTASQRRCKVPSVCLALTRAFNSRYTDLSVVVKGDWLPVRLFGHGYILCAMLRSWYLSLWLLALQHRHTYDVLIVDQLSASLPLLRLLPKTKVTRLLNAVSHALTTTSYK